MKNALLTCAVLVVYLLHQDVWFWRAARPLVFGFLSIGIFYHAGYCVVASGLLALLVKYTWPEHLEREGQPSPSPPAGPR